MYAADCGRAFFCGSPGLLIPGLMADFGVCTSIWLVLMLLLFPTVPLPVGLRLNLLAPTCAETGRILNFG